MKDMVDQPVCQVIQNIHDLLILIFFIFLMLINKFIQFVDKFLMLNLLGKNLFVLDGFLGFPALDIDLTINVSFISSL